MCYVKLNGLLQIKKLEMKIIQTNMRAMITKLLIFFLE